jgi:peroxin-16
MASVSYVLSLNSLCRAILRLLILRTTRRPLASPPIPEREFDPSALPETSSVSSSPTLAPSSAPGSPPRTPDHLRNNHIPLSHQPHQSLHPLLTPPPPMQAPTPVEDFLLPKALTTADVRSPLALIKPFMGLSDLSSEITYILRPLVYGRLLSWHRISATAN